MKKTLFILCALVCGTLAFAQTDGTYTGNLYVSVEGSESNTPNSQVTVAWDEVNTTLLDFTLHDFSITLGALSLDLGDITVKDVNVTEGTNEATISCSDDHEVELATAVNLLVDEVSVTMTGTISEDKLYADMTISVQLASLLGGSTYDITTTFRAGYDDLNGDYLIVDAESGYYLAGGLDYGTHATLGGKPQFITFEAQGDGTYKLDTHQYNYGNHYFGTASTTTASSTDFYFDALYPLNWTIEEVDGGGYLISNTTVGYLKAAGFQKEMGKTTDLSEATVWTLVTKDDVIAKMENATVDNPVDVTALIPAPEPKHNNWENSWTMTAYDGYSTIGNGTLGQDGNTASCAETWHSSNGFDMHQIVTFPMAGYYILSAQAFHDLLAWGSDVYPSMYAGDRSVEIYHGTVSSTGGVTDMANAYQDLLKGLHPLSLCLYVEEDNTDLTVGFTSNYAGGDVWTVFGELGLQYLGNDSYEGFVVHEEEAEVGDWSITSTGTFHLNNWSTEADPSGMVVPFMEYWCGSGSTLAAATISHEQLTGLYPGVYEVSLDIRVLNENSGNVTEGTLFKANDASEDLVTGTDSHDDTFSNSDDVYGTYTLTCVVDANGTLDISIEIPDDVTYDWIAFKNLKVTFVELAEDTYTNDVTWKLANPSFEVDNVVENLEVDTGADNGGTARHNTESKGAWIVESLTGWDLSIPNTVDACDLMTKDAAATDNNLGTPGEAADGTYMLYLKTTWTGDNTVSASVKQTVSLPAGDYKLTVDSKFHSGGATAKLVAGDNSTAIKVNGTASGTASTDAIFSSEAWTTNTVTFTVAQEGEVTVGVEITFTNNAPGSILLDNFKLYSVDAIEESISWTMTTAGWGTLILPFAESIPSGLTMYAGDALTLDEDGSTITVSTEANTITANTPYLVKGEVEEDTKYTFTGTPTNEGEIHTTGLLTGTLVDLAVATGAAFTLTGTEYLLQHHDGEDDSAAFYPIIVTDGENDSSEATLNAYHCYLTLDSTSPDGVRAFISLPGSDDEATAIKAVESAEAEGNGAIYDLSGRKVSKAVKGVYIQNGKKVLVK